MDKKKIYFFLKIQISTVQYCLKLQNITVALLIKSNILKNPRTSSSRKKSNILYVLKFSLKFKKKNSNDNTERCIVRYKYSIMGNISIYSNKDFSSLKNDLFVFQLA